MTQTEQRTIRRDMALFTGIIIILIIVGLLFIYSASMVYALEKHGNALYFVKKQATGILLGIIAFLVARFMPLHLVKSISPWALLISLVLTMLTVVSPFGHKIHGSSRWLSIHGFTFQPSELLKTACIVYLAYFLSRREKRVGSLLSIYLPFIGIVGIIALVLLKQPDFGMALTICISALMLFFIMYTNWWYVGMSIALLIPASAVLILMKPYRVQRVLTFLNPWKDPQGSGFQIIQSLIAIGSGGIGGLGIAHSKQKFFYLPMQHTDFIFSIIAEETGFIGSLIIISLYCILLYIGIRLALKMNDPFGMLCIAGFVIMTTLQAFINISVATALVPTKGTGLPFISYGKSALICGMGMVGLMINIVRHNPPARNKY